MAGFNWERVREIRHFSHPHILELNNLVRAGAGAGEQYCKGCNKSVENGLMVYSCKPCNFFLHLSCSQIPQQINHPADNHVLNLLSQPWAYGKGTCYCNACGQEMRYGFSFHCSICQLDLHPSCANLPMKFNHQHHPHRTLALSFSPPYPDKAFKCDVCNKCSQNSWHYHCSECFFDVHVTCTQISSLRERLMNQFLENHTQGLSGGHIPTREYPLFKGHGYKGRSYNEPQPLRFNSPFARPPMFTNSSSFHAHQQQQQPPLPSAYGNRKHNTFAQQGMEAIMQNAFGTTSTNSNFMNMMGSGIPGGDGSAILGNFSSSNYNFMNMLGSGIPGGDVSGILGNLSSLGDLSGIIGSMFGLGFF